MKLNKLIKNKKNILKTISSLFCASSILSCFTLISCSSNSNKDFYEELFHKGININDIVNSDLQNWTVDQFISKNFSSIFATNDWLSNNKESILGDLNSDSIAIKSYNNEMVSNFTNGTITLKVYLENNSETKNKSFPKIYDLILTNFRKGFLIPNVKSSIDVGLINENYSRLTLDQFVDLYFNNNQSINQWLNDNKSNFFESKELVDEISIN
ncbi:MAG: hypothetical protein K2H80_00815, partial [Ureaplasma sp.]|nr:hypothetical protein [Ureaplasma sp.]